MFIPQNLIASIFFIMIACCPMGKFISFNVSFNSVSENDFNSSSFSSCCLHRSTQLYNSKFCKISSIASCSITAEKNANQMFRHIAYLQQIENECSINRFVILDKNMIHVLSYKNMKEIIFILKCLPLK